MHKDLIAKVLGVTVKSVYNYEKENRPIISLLEKYYRDEDLEEFIKTGKISRLDNTEISESKINQYEEIVLDNAFYSVKDKIKIYTARLFQGGGYKLKDVLLKALDAIDDKEEILDIDSTKQTLFDSINGVEIIVMWVIPAKAKVVSVSTWVKYNLSKVEAYVLVKHYKEIFDMIDKEDKLK